MLVLSNLNQQLVSFLAQILQTHPHLLPAASDQQLKHLQTDRDAQKEESLTSSDDVLDKRDSHQSFYKEATDQIRRPDDKITQILHLLAFKGFNARGTVSLLGGHNIGSSGCEFIRPRLYNFQGTGRPNPSIPPDFLFQLRHECLDILDIIIKNDTKNKLPKFITLYEPVLKYLKTLSSSVPYGAAFDTLDTTIGAC